MEKIKTVESYPLTWPDGYKRTHARKSSNFLKVKERDGYSRREPRTLYESRNDLRDEVRRLGGKDLIISTNIRTRADGDIYSGAREPDDPGVAIYFKLKGKPVCIACDLWRHVWENTWAIAKTIDAMRGMERWGVSGVLDRVFTGFLALPATIGDPWHVDFHDYGVNCSMMAWFDKRVHRRLHGDNPGSLPGEVNGVSPGPRWESGGGGAREQGL